MITLLAIIWWPTYGDALQMGVQKNVPTVVYFTSPSCKYCVAMEAGPLRDKGIVTTLNRNYTACKLIDASSNVRDSFGVTALPAIVVISNGKRWTFQGYKSAAELQSILATRWDR